MNPEERARAAKAFISNPLMKHLLATMRQEHLEAIAASPLPDVEGRSYNYTATRVIDQMMGQLEVWARTVK